ncbi:hypothetical protein CDIK_1487 [Cucumispora dikerogammari]|nr:hypothetical protein CDIK_1487 [Cucumispora dikerogammari]
MDEDRRIMRELNKLLKEANELEKETAEVNIKLNNLEKEYNLIRSQQSIATSTSTFITDKENIKNTNKALIDEYLKLKLDTERTKIAIFFISQVNSINAAYLTELKYVNMFLKFIDCKIEYSSLNLFETRITIKYNMGDYLTKVNFEIDIRPKSVSLIKVTKEGFREVGFCVKRRRIAEFVARLFLEENS